MRTLSEKKQYLILPDEPPTSWPSGWQFPPPPWPPGWPRGKNIENVRFEVTIWGFVLHAARMQIGVQILDEFNEPTDILDGELVSIVAHNQGKRIRMRALEDEPYSKTVLLKIGPVGLPNEGIHGVQQILNVEAVHGDQVEFVVSIFGLNQGAISKELEF